MHELVREAKNLAIPVCDELVAMLDEHVEHKSARRGSGYTQATRYLQDFINTSDSKREKIFRESLPALPLMQQLLNQLEYVESRQLWLILMDIIHPKLPDVSLPALQTTNEKEPPVGSCPMAEQFFLEVAYDRIRRGGSVHVWLDQKNQPRLLEKCGLGDSHSAISVAPMIINGVELPMGCLFGLDYPTHIPPLRATRNGRGHVYQLQNLRRLRYLRFSTLVIPPKDRKRAFSSHFEQQIQNDLFSPGVTEINQLRAYADREFA
jgi:hypothetical protein